MDVYVGTFNKKKASFGHCAMKIRKVLLTPLLGVGKSFVSCDLCPLSSSGLSWIRDVMTPAGHITTNLCTTPSRNTNFSMSHSQHYNITVTVVQIRVQTVEGAVVWRHQTMHRPHHYSRWVRRYNALGKPSVHIISKSCCHFLLTVTHLL